MCDRWPEQEYEISFILESIDGVYKTFASGRSRSVKIWYDEKKTNVNAFIKNLEEKEYHVSGEPGKNLALNFIQISLISEIHPQL